MAKFFLRFRFECPIYLHSRLVIISKAEHSLHINLHS
jgi:hypothetical protein